MLPLAAILLACGLPAGQYPLESLSEPEVEDFRATARAVLDHEPSRGWDLEVALHFETSEGHAVFDLSRVQLRSGSLRWVRCHLPPEQAEDPAALALRVDPPGADYTLRCEQVPRPDHGLELRLPAVGAGLPRYLEFSFAGLKDGSGPVEAPGEAGSGD